jgi:hypothetical protein
MAKIQKIKNSLFALFLLFSVTSCLAAEVYFDGEQEFGLGNQFRIDLIINTEDEAINAIEGSITFQSDFLKVKEFSDGDSIVNFWLQKPKLTLNNKISFSGITPGGYIGNKGKVFSIIFQSLKEGEVDIKFSNLKILLNDGSGTAAQVKTTGMKIKISGGPEASASAPIQETDNEPPETFMPEIASSPDIFDGQWFLVFATQDKISGIDHYEVKEGWGGFNVAESPYLLKNQNLDKKISVKAVDKNGNERTIVLPAKISRWYKNYLIWLIIILLMISVYVFIKKFYGGKKK